MDGIKRVMRPRAVAPVAKPIETIEEKVEAFKLKSFGLRFKMISAVVAVSLISIIVPHHSYADEMDEHVMGRFVFEAGDHTQFVEEVETGASATAKQQRHEATVAKLRKQLRMNEALKKYLQENRSPLAEYSHVLLQQNNWKKIVALSNAESTMCRRYIEATSNCWGVGGTDLWDMGDNLGEGVIAMNNFLNTAPRKSNVKYSQMNFEQMNGLYKQPARDHWVYNNLQVWNELTALEKSVK